MSLQYKTNQIYEVGKIFNVYTILPFNSWFLKTTVQLYEQLII